VELKKYIQMRLEMVGKNGLNEPESENEDTVILS
jgi:hypothetical protein